MPVPRTLSPVLLAAILCTALPAAGAGAPDPARLESLRREFVAAESALAAGREAELARHLAALRAYPLYPYLAAADLRRRLAGAPEAEVAAFLARFADTPPGADLRDARLYQLARAGRWQRFLELYRPPHETALQCLRLRALLATGRRAEALARVEPLWLSGRSQPDECDPVFAAWRESGALTPERVRARIRLAMAAGQPGLAGYLARFLPPAERPLVGLWRRVRVEPGRVRDPALLRRRGPLIDAILVDGLRRLARRDPAAAAAAWPQVRERHPFAPEAAAAALRGIGLELAWQHAPQALEWLEAVPAAYVDRSVREWRVRSAVRAGRWARVLHHVAALEPAARRQPRWRYWHARALEALGRGGEARPLWQRLATDRSFHGFLAAEHLGQGYRFSDRPLRFDAAELAPIEALPAVRRARELRALGRDHAARREWHFAIRDMQRGDLARAAVVAGRHGWHGLAILTLGRIPYLDDLALRFPVAYGEPVREAAARRDLDPAWLLAVMRQESAFMADAVSPRGALGLMQLMPGTGRQLARSLRTRLRHRSELLDPGTSIRLGSAYLRELLQRFDGHPALATAAYNAGPAAVRRWREAAGGLAADRWIESIPYAETRRYVERVLAYTVIYRARLGLEPVSLGARLPPVPVRHARGGGGDRPG